MITNQRVRIVIDGRTYRARVVIGSENLRSLAVEVDDEEFQCRHLRAGGMVIGPLLLVSEDGRLYRDVTSDLEAVVEWEGSLS